MKYYSVRNKFGRFVRNKKSPAKRVIKKKTLQLIHNGSLYDWNGVTVRVLKDLNNGMKLVGIHNSLFGFAKTEELNKITLEKVNYYLANA